MKKIILLTFCMLLCLAGQGKPVATAATAGSNGASVAPVARPAQQTLSVSEMATVIVTLRDQANLRTIREPQRGARRRQLLQALRGKADTTQAPLRRLLETRRQQGKVGAVTGYWVFNGFTVTATQEVIDELAAHPAVASIAPNTTFFAPATAALQTGVPAEPNVALVNTPALWELGIRGQGIVVANLDTGVDLYHADLANKWRGGANSWFDPYGQHATPADVAGAASGHGTWTMGVMVGGSAGGTAVGMAPDAQWIAAKIFNNQGAATTAGIHAAFQWLLDPDGDPQTDDAPHVVNNSWTFQNPGCNLEFQLDLQALRVAGIVPVFAAGNGGPGSETSYSPANYPEALAVGAINNNNAIYTNSSRGPSACGEAPTIYPELVAPGVNVKTTDLYGLYASRTGTSLAAPHVAGALALLLSAYPNLTADEQTSALFTTIMDLGDSGADTTFGYGRLDILAAYQSLLPTNQPPSVDAGPDQTITLPDAATLNGMVTDDGLPAPPVLTVAWSQVDGPGVVTFADANAAATVATFSTEGVYILRLTASDGLLSSSDEVVVTANPAPPTANVFFVSSDGNGKVGGVSYQDEDILVLNPATGTWSRFFDASRYGITGDIDAFEVLTNGDILLSLDAPATLPGLGAVDDSDIVRIDAASGSFDWYLVGARVGLTTDAEDVDAIALAPDGRLVISTLGKFSVPGPAGATITGDDKDLLVFTGTLGAGSSGYWTLYLKGSAIGLADKNENVWGAWIDPANGALHWSTKGAFSASGTNGPLTGDGNDIAACNPFTPTATCTLARFWDSAAHGFAKTLDGISIGPMPPVVYAADTQADASETAMDADTSGDDSEDEETEQSESLDGTEEDAQQVFLPIINR
ncbi:MAG: hypothetical protein DCC55_18600 [Chloroflexi bacterium]|nr:MAG: hypothetical protein DCC55_18600 [Chloroflexota bacterium]